MIKKFADALDACYYYDKKGELHFYRFRDVPDPDPYTEDGANYYLDHTLLEHFHKLNEKGQEKALDQIELLTKIPEYRKENM